MTQEQVLALLEGDLREINGGERPKHPYPYKLLSFVSFLFKMKRKEPGEPEFRECRSIKVMDLLLLEHRIRNSFPEIRFAGLTEEDTSKWSKK